MPVVDTRNYDHKYKYKKYIVVASNVRRGFKHFCKNDAQTNGSVIKCFRDWCMMCFIAQHPQVSTSNYKGNT